MSHKSISSQIRIARTFCVVSGLILLCSIGVTAQKKGDDEAPVFREYRGVQIGMTSDEARKKLGSPKDKGDDQDLYTFNDLEMAVVGYDKTHKVSVLSIDFMTGATGIPAAKTVIGSDIEAKTDGSMYKMIRYAKAGFWVSYSRTAGDSPMVSITIQKIE
ncbi:MAG TPA: hypothetical protein VN643_13105 [Pyrinomonadaceae bacterium]|nr:hypothetical protein [Pyrinomonadaceae bacterium]